MYVLVGNMETKAQQKKSNELLFAPQRLGVDFESLFQSTNIVELTVEDVNEDVENFCVDIRCRSGRADASSCYRNENVRRRFGCFARIRFLRMV